MSEKRLVRKHPLAFGITKWGPLPGTRDMWILWAGPGSGLEVYARDPGTGPASENLGVPVRHPAANGHYDTVADAEKAVHAFIRAGVASQS